VPTATPVPTATAVPTPQPSIATIRPSQDNTLYEDPSGGLSNGFGAGLFVGTTRNGLIRRTLIAFDVAGSIPSGVTISSVRLEMTMTRTTAGSASAELHRVTTDWGEGSSDAAAQEGAGAAAATNDATWLHSFFNSVQWSSTGGDFVSSSSANTTISGGGTYTWGSSSKMVADVQGWLKGPSSNFGWIILGDEGSSRTAKRFGSRESSSAGERPSLIVEYVP
jgi:hypothetical protein